MKKKKSTAKAPGKPSVSSSMASVGDSDATGQEPKTSEGVVAVTVPHLEFPPPEYLLEQALGEPNRKLIQDYRETINVLRDEKGFSFREIAAWLTEKGVEADYNSVYRVYTKGMSEIEVAEVDHREAEGD